MRTFASTLFLFLGLNAAAQRECATQVYNTITPTPGKAAVDAFVQQQSRNFISGNQGTNTTDSKTKLIRIPVVIHLLYNTAAQNISEAQIQSGLAALNRDFRKQNSDTANIPDRFKSFAADVAIEFQLATADPNGVATTGIIRKQTSAAAFDMDDKIKFSAQGGDDAWDSKSYLNIWLGNTRRLLGYASMPGGDAAVDGLVINITAFGTINTGAPYNLGRTAVHEAGHWLGLKHIWGDEACGDDLVDDTPKQGGYTTGCPTGFRSSCGNTATGDMYMNYMDFTNDACLNLFTYGQKDRMRAMFAGGGPRASLLESKGLSEPTAEAPLPKQDEKQLPFFQLYPNPAAEEVVLQFNTAENLSGSELQLVNAGGVVIQKLRLTSNTQRITLAHLRPGLYFVSGVLNNVPVTRKLVKL